MAWVTLKAENEKYAPITLRQGEFSHRGASGWIITKILGVQIVQAVERGIRAVDFLWNYWKRLELLRFEVFFF